jgi:hypothetical protein
MVIANTGEKTGQLEGAPATARQDADGEVSERSTRRKA